MINSTETPTNFDLVKTARSITINCPISDIRQILVDISVLVQGDAKSGIQRVVRSILLELLISPPQGYTVKPIYFDNMRYRYANRFVNRFIGNKEAGLEDDVVDVNHGDIYLGLDLMSHLTLKIHSYLKRLNILGIKIVFIVYDIIFTQHPEWWPESTSKILLQWLESITEVSTGLVCISHSTAVEVEEWLDSNPPNRAEPLPIEFFHLGADIENSVPTKGVPDDASFVFKALESAPTFLMVGTIEPRKGHAQAISAFESLWNDGLEVNLVIVGKKGWLVEDLVNRIRSHSMLGKRLFWLDGISDEYLNEIYTASTSLLFASEAEGFGLPLIEAAQKKLPIIARDIPVFREVAGEYAYYFSGMSPDNLAQALKTWLGLHKNGKNPSSVGMPWLTWKESASQLLKAIITNTASKKG